MRNSEMGSLGTGVGTANVLVIPIAPQGHLSPMLRLAAQLARDGVRVTFACPQEVVTRLTSAGGNYSSSELQDLPFRFLPLHMLEGEDLNGRMAFDASFYQQAFKPIKEQMLREKVTGIGGCPTSILSDVFLDWTKDLATELQIPRYMFVASGVIFVQLMQGCLEYYRSGQFQISETDGTLTPFDWPVRISGLPPLRFDELPYGFHRPAEWIPKFESVGVAAGVLVNSFFELEENVIEAWKRVGNPGLEHIKVPQIYPVGPLFSTTVPNVQAAPKGLQDSASKCVTWLDSQPSSSVLYIAFGSHVRLTPEQIKEMALGLESSQQRFLWVIPQTKGSSGEEPQASVTEILPPGFEARVANRSCIVTGWAPQLQILAHSATGGFLTHCGWNSSLESVILGVPMISWPQGAEQHLNCRYLVDDLKIAEQLRTGPANILKRSEVERAVRLLMVEDDGKTIRRRVDELKTKAAAAVADGGSQSRFFGEFVDAVRQLEPSPKSGGQ